MISAKVLRGAIAEAHAQIKAERANQFDWDTIPDPVSWIENNFYLADTGTLIHLYPRDRYFIQKALSRDSTGKYTYTTIIYSQIKKSGKSSKIAALCDWLASNKPRALLRLTGNDLRQAQSRVGYYLKENIKIGQKQGKRDTAIQVNRLSVEYPNGSLIEMIPQDPTGEAGGNDDLICFCFDEKTEVLTQNGWRNWKTLQENDPIATLSPFGMFEWQKPKAIYCKPYKGRMIGIDHTRLSMLVTPEHRVFGAFYKDHVVGMNLHWELKPAKEAKEYSFHKPYMACHNYVGVIPKSKRVIRINATLKKPALELELMDYVELLAWWLSEGSISFNTRTKRPEGVLIAQGVQQNPVNRQRILTLLNDMDLSPREWSDGMNIAVWHSRLAEHFAQFGKAKTKSIPQWVKDLPRPYLKRFLETYIKGDGYKIGKGYCISTQSLQMRDDLMEVAQKCSYGVSYWQETDTRWKTNPVLYTVRLTRGRIRTPQVVKKHWYEVDYDGMVFCPSTRNGVVYVRREGRCYWSGNSELWGWKNQAQMNSWAELTLSPTKYGMAQRWVDTYAGFSDGGSPILWDLYQRVVQQGECIHEGYEVYHNPKAKVLAMWQTQPSYPWQTEDYYASEEVTLTPSQFNRMHRNQWTSSVSAFIEPEEWDACYRDDVKPLTKMEGIVIAMDAGLSNDSFGVLALSRSGDQVIVRYAREWIPPQGGVVDFDEPANEVRRLCKQYNVYGVCYDPWQLHKLAQDLQEETGILFTPISQQGKRPIADKMLYDAIRYRNIVQQGHPALTQHVRNADKDEMGQKQVDRIKIIKRSDILKIDLCVCASMAVYWAYEVLPG